MQELGLLAECRSLSGEMLLPGPSLAANQLPVCCHTGWVGQQQALAQVHHEQENPGFSLIAAGTQVCVCESMCE